FGAETAAPPSAPASVPDIAQPPAPQVHNSILDGALLKQLLLADFALQDGQAGDAVEIYIQAGRRYKDDALFRRAYQIALQVGAGDKALAVTKAWRQAMPRSAEATRTEVQVLVGLDRVAEAQEPLEQLLQMSPPAERGPLLASLPRVVERAKDRAAVAAEASELVKPYLDAPETSLPARVALARIDMLQGQAGEALRLAEQAHAQDPLATPPVMLALDIMNALSGVAPTRAAGTAAPAGTEAPTKRDVPADAIPRSEAIVRDYLARKGADPVVRSFYASVLSSEERLPEAAEQLRMATKERPKLAQLWIALGDAELELHHPDAAEAALKQALALAMADQAAHPSNGDEDDAAGDADAAAPGPRLDYIRLLLARAADQRRDDAAMEKWLGEIDTKDTDLQVIALRAEVLARRGKLAEALALVRAAPATSPAEERYRLLTQAQLLIESKKFADARELLAKANKESPDDVELIYQEAMVDERMNRLDDMETLLRRILVLQPQNSQALNALGYSLADQNVRLDEALGLVKQAHALSPADPFIVDSLGWVEYRMGHYDTATTLLSQAYASRKDTEIAAHLGEALWAEGRRDEAVQVLRDAHRLEPGNEVLRQTMARLKVTP
ncbi:MAG TPA: tetratricopeptide repeat protein, partial [Burkholderiaceae bacterium]